MSDTRFTLIGIGLIFAGFLVLGIFGGHHYNLAVQSQELGQCFEYNDGMEVEIDCEAAAQDRVLFFAIVAGLIGGGVFFLVKGVRGRWDQDVKQQDKLGPDSSFPS